MYLSAQEAPKGRMPMIRYSKTVDHCLNYCRNMNVLVRDLQHFSVCSFLPQAEVFISHRQVSL